MYVYVYIYDTEKNWDTLYPDKERLSTTNQTLRKGIREGEITLTRMSSQLLQLTPQYKKTKHMEILLLVLYRCSRPFWWFQLLVWRLRKL